MRSAGISSNVVTRGVGAGVGGGNQRNAAPSFAGGRRFVENVDEDDEHDDDKEEEEVSAELIRRAAANIKALRGPPTGLREYEVRLANRELIDLLQRSTNRSFSALSPAVERLVRSGGVAAPPAASSSSSASSAAAAAAAAAVVPSSTASGTLADFQLLKSELDRVLKQLADNEALAARLSQEILARSSAPGVRYSPMDLLDVSLISGGGTVCASSNLVMQALTILHEHWVVFAASEAASRGGNLGDALIQSRQQPCAAAQMPSAPAAAASLLLSQDDTELTAEFASLLKEHLVPPAVCGAFFQLVSPPFSPALRKLRLSAMIARLKAPLIVAARRSFTETLSTKLDPDQLLDLVDGGDAFLPLLKAWELSSGVPFMLPAHLAKRCIPRSVHDSDEEPCHVAAALTKMLKS
jgi:hypothetical protein